jgi:fatty acid-binding protein DegV
MALKIIVDSSIGLSQKEALERGYFFIPLSITLGEKTYAEGIDITPDEFYALIGKGFLPHTGAPSPELYRLAFNEATKEGDEALLLSLSSKISGAWQAANLAQKECDHPEKVHLFDTLSFFCGSQILLQEAEEKQDLPINDLLDYLEDLKKRIHVSQEWTLSPTSIRAAAFKIPLRPRRLPPRQSHRHARGRPRHDRRQGDGTKNAMAFVMDKTREYPIDFSYPAYVFYSSDKAILDRFLNEDFYPAYPEGKAWPVAQINPLIGSHIGPLVYGVFYVAKEKEETPKRSLFKKIHEDIHHVFHKKDGSGK